MNRDVFPNSYSVNPKLHADGNIPQVQLSAMSLTAKRLEQAMRQRGWDQKELANRVDATQGAISKILVGKTSNSRLMPKIATHLGVSLAWLLGTSDDESVDATTIAYSSEELEWLDLLRGLDPKDRQALIQLTRTIATSARSPRIHERQQDYRG